MHQKKNPALKALLRFFQMLDFGSLSGLQYYWRPLFELKLGVQKNLNEAVKAGSVDIALLLHDRGQIDQKRGECAVIYSGV